MLNSLLTEIERHQGLVILATNRPYELDEAMHRRITCVLEYRPPDHTMRQKIWENLLGTTTEVKRGDNNNDPTSIWHVHYIRVLNDGERVMEQDDFCGTFDQVYNTFIPLRALF